jgi:predicted GNAT superfamily acetyltransferase
VSPSATGLGESVEIPADFATLKRADIEQARRWRINTRTQFQSRLSRGLVAVAVVRDSSRGTSRYVFDAEEVVADAIR